MVETVRRLILTAVLSVCAPGSSSQAVFAIFVSHFYIKVYGYYAPYANSQDSILAETGQFQVYITFFGALIVQNALLPAFWTPPLGIALIVVNMSVLYYILLTQLRNALKQEEEEGGEQEDEDAARAGTPSRGLETRRRGGQLQQLHGAPDSDDDSSSDDDDAAADDTEWGDVEMRGR